MSLSALSHLQYTDEDIPISASAAANNSRSDGELLLAHYDLARLGEVVDRDSIASGPSSLWRYAPLLPVQDPAQAVTLGEGWTPMIPARRLGKRLGLEKLFIKDEGRNPSGAFKDRGATVAVSRLRELGVNTVIHNSSGNAGAAWAIYAARAGMRCVNVLPEDALTASVVQSVIAGAATIQIADRWQRSGAIVQQAVEKHGWFNVGTLREPYRLEGKKTMGLEICEQLGWSMPDFVVYPAGGGLGAIAIYKAFDELETLGWIEKGRRPGLIITQYSGCAPIVKAYRDGADRAGEWQDLDVLPGGLKSTNPPGAKAVLKLVRETGGTCIDVTTEESLAAAAEMAAAEGIFACPESATTLVGLRKALATLPIEPSSTIVLMSTGSGLKSIQNFPAPETIHLPAGAAITAELLQFPASADERH